MPPQTGAALTQPPDDAGPLPGLATWRIDVSTRRLQGSPALSLLLGLGGSPVDESLAGLERRVHPDDLLEVRRAWAQALQDGTLECELRVRRPDGRIAWLELLGCSEQGIGDAPLCLSGVARDVTRRKSDSRLGPEPQARLNALFEMGNLGLAQIDTQSRQLVRANKRLHDMLGHLNGQLVGRRYVDLIHPADQAAHSQTLRRLLRGEITAHDVELRLLRRDGGSLWVLLALGLQRDADGAPALVTAAAIGIQERKRAEQLLVQREEQSRLAGEELEERLEEHGAELAAVSAALQREIAERRAAEQRVGELLGRHVQAIEDERGRISRELHDTLGQHLAALDIGLKMVDDMPGRPEAVHERLLQLREVLDRLEDQIDRLSHELRPPALDELGLEDALRSYAEAWSSDSGVELELHTHGLRTGRLPALVETTVYRVVQEALTNVRKHAAARRVGVIVERRLDELRTVVEDDGRGFDPVGASPDGGRHWGLRSMAERALLVAGQFQVEASPGGGTTVYLAIPVRSGMAPPEQEG